MANLNMKILIVDDFSTMRRIIRNILKQIGYSDIHDAEDGTQAITKLKADRFDFVISDWNMPNMSGLDLLKAIRTDADLKDTKFLMVTAETMQESVIAAVQAGVNNYIIKPFTAETMKERIDRIFPE